MPLCSKAGFPFQRTEKKKMNIDGLCLPAQTWLNGSTNRKQWTVLTPPPPHTNTHIQYTHPLPQQLYMGSLNNKDVTLRVGLKKCGSGVSKLPIIQAKLKGERCWSHGQRDGWLVACSACYPQPTYCFLYQQSFRSLCPWFVLGQRCLYGFEWVHMYPFVSLWDLICWNCSQMFVVRVCAPVDVHIPQYALF